jgi:hypothetical protein
MIIFLFTTTPEELWGPSVLLCCGHRNSFPVKKPECEADHTLFSNAEVNDVWGLKPLPKHAVIEWCLGKGAPLPLLSACERMVLLLRPFVLTFDHLIIQDAVLTASVEVPMWNGVTFMSSELVRVWGGRSCVL